MDFLLRVIAAMPSADWLGLAAFFSGWLGYVRFARTRALRRPSVLASTNRIRQEWMLQTTYREVRVIDGVVVQSLSTSPSFFASTTILIIGGLLAVLGSDKANELVRDLPFASRTTTLIFDLKLILLLGIFVYVFFRFTWSMRQYTFGALLVAAAPEAERFISEGLSREAFADKAGRIVGLAAETFNDGLRAYYFSFAALAWFISPLVMVAGTVVVVAILYGREFHSDVLRVLRD